MSPGKFDWDKFLKRPLIGILRGFSCEQAIGAARASLQGGLTTLEVTMNSPDAATQIEQLTDLLGEQMSIGAGTVCTLDDLHAACNAGASFIVTPVISPEVIAECVTRKIPVFAGAMTPSEIYQVWRLGASMVKVFPCDQLGPAYIKNVKAPLPQISLMPTGGITVDNIAAFQQAGADAFGVGSTLFAKSRVAAADWEWITTQTRQFIEALEPASKLR